MIYEKFGKEFKIKQQNNINNNLEEFSLDNTKIYNKNSLETINLNMGWYISFSS